MVMSDMPLHENTRSAHDFVIAVTDGASLPGPLRGCLT